MGKTRRANLTWKGGCIGLKSEIFLCEPLNSTDFWRSGLELKAVETARTFCKLQIPNSNSLIQKTSVLNT